jgi:hypothetical protein
VLVHGTGVREPAYTALFDHVRSNVAELAPGVPLLPCYWGGACGTQLHHSGKSIPEYDTARAIEDVDPDDAAAVRWDLLNQDPLLELRLLGSRATVGARLGGDETPAEEMAGALERLEPAGALADHLARAGLTDTFDSARDTVAGSDAFRRAVASAEADVAELRFATARAVVVLAIRTADAALMASDGFDGHGVVPVWTVAGPVRDEIVERVMDELGGQDRGVFDWLGQQVTGLAAWYGTRKVRRKRGAITDAGSAAAGDILFYQARGTHIREFIAGAVRKAKPPVTLIAHSLGGIASVDLLVSGQVPEVELLVTVGSQAPYLYELNALVSLEWSQALPVDFPRWLNIYDPRDFLSYLAAPVFTGTQKGVRDVEVDNRESFPRSHSAYWSNPATWRAIAEEARWQ